MKAELRFKDSDARVVQHYLRKRYNKPRAGLETLLMIAVRREVAEQAKVELANLPSRRRRSSDEGA